MIDIKVAVEATGADRTHAHVAEAGGRYAEATVETRRRHARVGLVDVGGRRAACRLRALAIGQLAVRARVAGQAGAHRPAVTVRHAWRVVHARIINCASVYLLSCI